MINSDQTIAGLLAIMASMEKVWKWLGQIDTERKIQMHKHRRNRS
jgi:hypothetical protein